MQKDNFKYAIALTGGIATGKSTVSNLFMLHGLLTIDTDKIAHKLLDEHSAALKDMFGEEYVYNNKTVRKKLGELIFNNVNEKKKLEKFLHPLIKQEVIRKSLIFDDQKKPYLVDIPLFFENENYNIRNSVVVYAPQSLQLKRLMSRDKCSADEANIRINNQMNIEKKIDKATFIIDNSKDLKSLQDEVEKIKLFLLKVV
ncbi:Dephospho-CoA kinase [hydrothermal vent metagenome]|uniref:Dephospho-CoA kinase n=1 Tax=hydrothermal vent metagenome TaxID=652676 RepID=A0A3B1DT07_9ZZZZ